MPKLLFFGLRIGVFLVIFVLGFHVFAQAPDLFPFYDISKCAYGFKDRSGKIIIDARFHKVRNFISEGICQVLVNDQWGLINKKGNFITQPTIENIWDFHPKYYVSPARSNGLWGFINKKGKWAILPKYQDIAYAQKGYFKIKPYLFIVEKNDLRGIVSSKGKEVLKPQYDRISEKFNLYGITKVVHNGKYGLIDSNANVMLPLIYKYLERNYHDLSMPYIITSADHLKGLCSSKGERLLPAIMNKINPFNLPDSSCRYTTYEKGKEKGIIDIYGNYWGKEAKKILTPVSTPPFLLINNKQELLIIDPKHAPKVCLINNYKYKDRYLSLLEDNYTGLFSTDNKHFLLLDEYGTLIYPDFLIHWHKERYKESADKERTIQHHCYNKDEEYGLYIIDKELKNKWIPPSFDDISLFDTLLKIRWINKDDHIGAINSLGEVMYDLIYDEVIYLHKESNNEFNGFYALKKDGVYALFNKEHVQLTDFFFKKIWYNNERIYGIDKESNPYFCPDMNNIRFISYENVNTTILNADSLVAVMNPNHSEKMMVLFRKDGKYGLIKASGELIEKGGFNKIRDFSRPYLFDDIYEFKVSSINNPDLTKEEIMIHNYVFEKNVLENLSTIKQIREYSWENQHYPNYVFLNKRKEITEIKEYEDSFKELYFSLHSMESLSYPFFSIKHQRETHTGRSVIIKKRINNFYLKNDQIKKVTMHDLFNDAIHHQAQLSTTLLQKLKELNHFDPGFCADESKFVMQKEYFTILPDGLLFHFKDNRNKGSGLWKDRQYKGADIFISYISIGHLIGKKSLLYPLLQKQIEN